MSAKIIPFGPVRASTADVEAPVTPEAIHAAIENLDAVERELQMQAHGIELSIGKVRRQRQHLLHQIDSSRSA